MNTSWRKNYLRYKTYLLNTVKQYKKREDVRVYLEILLSLATITLFAVLALRPTLLTIAELLKDIESKKETVAIMDKKIKNINAAQFLMDQERERVEKLKIAIPDSADPEVFIRQLEGVAGKNQVVVSDFSIGKSVILGSQSSDTNSTPEGTQSLNFSIKSASEPAVLQNLLRDIEDLRRPTVINNINFVQEIDPVSDEKEITMTVRGASPIYKKITDDSTNQQ